MIWLFCKFLRVDFNAKDAEKRTEPQTLATKLNNPSAGAAHGRETKKQTL